MYKGLINPSNALCNGNLLVDHPSMSVQPGTPAYRLKEFLQARYTSLWHESEGEIQPILLNVPGLRETEENGTSKWNNHNIAVGLCLLEDLLSQDNLQITANMIGIATGYSAQMRNWRKHLAIMNKKHPACGWNLIIVGTAEYWQGREIPLVITSLVRVANASLAKPSVHHGQSESWLRMEQDHCRERRVLASQGDYFHDHGFGARGQRQWKHWIHIQDCTPQRPSQSPANQSTRSRGCWLHIDGLQ